MKNFLTNEKRILPILALFTVFLFALSPLSLVSVAATSHVTHPAKPTGFYPNATGPLVANTVNRPNPAGNKGCPAKDICTVVAEGLGGVQVLLGKKVIASVYIPLTPSDPSTCPEGALYVSGVGYLVFDPCGNNGAGEARVFSATTLTWSTPWTNVGGEPIFGIMAGGNIYVVNFGYSTVTELTTSDTVVATITTCGYYPEFLAVQSGNVYESNQYGYDSSTGYYAGCIDEISGSSVVATLWGDATNGPGAYEYPFTGIGVTSSGDIYVNVAYYYTGYSYGATFMATSMSAWSTAGPLYLANEYAVWGMSSSSSAVFPISPYNYNLTSYQFSEVGFTFQISGTTVGPAYLTAGLEPEFTCPGKGTTWVDPDYAANGASPYLDYVLHPPVPSTTPGATVYGFMEAFGCGTN